MKFISVLILASIAIILMAWNVDEAATYDQVKLKHKWIAALCFIPLQWFDTSNRPFSNDIVIEVSNMNE